MCRENLQSERVQPKDTVELCPQTCIATIATSAYSDLHQGDPRLHQMGGVVSLSRGPSPHSWCSQPILELSWATSTSKLTGWAQYEAHDPGGSSKTRSRGPESSVDRHGHPRKTEAPPRQSSPVLAMETSGECPAFCTHVPSERGKECLLQRARAQKRGQCPRRCQQAHSPTGSTLISPLHSPVTRSFWSAQLVPPPPVPTFSSVGTAVARQNSSELAR